MSGAGEDRAGRADRAGEADPAPLAPAAPAPDGPPHVLWGMPASLYTGKVRAFLRKRRIPFDERVPGDARFRSEVVPAVGRWIIPVLQCPDGTLVQDGAVIIEHLDRSAPGGPPALPADPALAALARLLELFGGEGLLRAAMHYRWNFDADNLEFLRADFGASLAPGAPPDIGAAAFEASSGRMRKAAVAIGVQPHAIPEIERSFLELIGLLDRHLGRTPYLLGPAPTVADYGFYGPFGPHLGRDPHPAALLKRRAHRVWRWVERMGAPDEDAGEFVGRIADWLDPGAPGETFEALLRFIAEDFLPELRALVGFADAWLAERPDLPAGTSGTPRPGDRSIGRMAFDWRGLRLESNALPYRLWLLQRFQDSVDALEPEPAQRLHALLARTGLQDLPRLRCRWRVERLGHLEVWGPPRAVADGTDPAPSRSRPAS
jgi:glutathione S-transferase